MPCWLVGTCNCEGYIEGGEAVNSFIGVVVELSVLLLLGVWKNGHIVHNTRVATVQSC